MISETTRRKHFKIVSIKLLKIIENFEEHFKTSKSVLQIKKYETYKRLYKLYIFKLVGVLIRFRDREMLNSREH